MKFGANRSQLYDAQKTARLRWDDTAETWDDQPKHEFTEQIWDPLDLAVSNVLRSVDQLTVLFTQVRQDCEFTP